MGVRRLGLCLLLFATACGRGPIGGLGGGDFDGGSNDGALVDTGALDVGVGDGAVRDFGSTDSSFDGGQPRDADVPDVFVECRVPRDCARTFGGPPNCGGGMPGRWNCVDGFCEADCPCRSDCDCPFDTACIAGGCMPAGRNNLCCTNPFCPPGSSCEEPNGGAGVCPSPDGGVRDTGVRDTGVRDTGVIDGATPDGSLPDFGTFDGNFPDVGTFDGNFPDVGSFDVGVPDVGTFDGGGPDSGVPSIGDPCAAQGLCGPVGFCIEEFSGFPGGYCSQSCGGGLSCPQGAVCRNFGPGQAVCLDECQNNAECRTGYACIQLGTDPNKVCWPVDPGSSNPNGEPVGGACGGDQDCDQGLTCLDFMGWPDGYCTKQFCDPVNNPCPNGSSCFAFSGVFSLCLDDCPSGGSQSTCRTDYYCLGPIGQPGGCVPN